VVAGVALLAMLLAACVQNGQNSLRPAGPYAQKAFDLFSLVFWIATAIFVIVEGLLIFFVIRYRHRKGQEEGIPPQIHGNTRLEIAWTIVPALIFAVVAVPTVTTIFDFARKPTGDVLNVNVLGHQWWWEFDYPNEKIVTANQMYIPVGKPVYLTLCAVGLGYGSEIVPSTCQPKTQANVGDAVIHSFWVPELAGTQDVIPNRTNHLTLQAERRGVVDRTCKELCGYSHENMRVQVIALAQAGFDDWVRAQQQDAVAPAPGSLAATGMKEFLNDGCIACHAIQGPLNANGQPAAAAVGAPNLTHFAGRSCFAGCIFQNTPEEGARWLADPPARKPGSWMPHYNLTPDQIDGLVAYLESLK